jgi:hypothetical protein
VGRNNCRECRFWSDLVTLSIEKWDGHLASIRPAHLPSFFQVSRTLPSRTALTPPTHCCTSMKSSSGLFFSLRQPPELRHCRIAITGACRWQWWSRKLKRPVQTGMHPLRGDTTAPDLRCHGQVPASNTRGPLAELHSEGPVAAATRASTTTRHGGRHECDARPAAV